MSDKHADEYGTLEVETTGSPRDSALLLTIGDGSGGWVEQTWLSAEGARWLRDRLDQWIKEPEERP